MDVVKNVDVHGNDKNCAYLNFDEDFLELKHDVNSDKIRPTHDHFALGVDDLYEGLKFFAKQGIDSKIEPTSGNKTAVTIFGPDNVQIEIFE